MAISGAGLQSIYERLNSAAQYHPLEADTFADWSLEAGDIVTVSRDNTDYESPVHSATHVWKGVQTVRISSGGEEKRESVARMSRKKYNTGGSGVRSGKALGNRITMMYNGLSAEIIQTESVMSTRMTDMYNGLESYVEQTASHWASALVDTYNGLSSLVVQTASMWSSQLNDAYNGLSSKVEQTASHWSSELSNAYQGLDSKVEQTASSWSSQLTNAYQGLSSKVEQTASTWSSQLTNAYQGLNSKVEQTASSWSTKISGVTDANGNVTAASIAVAINEAGESTAHISADKVYIGNSKSSTVISGKLDADDVTADFIAGKLADINYATFKQIQASNIWIDARTGGNPLSMATAFRDLQIVGPTNNQYQLQGLRYNAFEWEDLGNPFSRAISSASWEWANGRPTVTLSPQSQSFSGQQITHATPSYDSTTNKWMMEIQAMGSGTPPTYTNIGHSVNLNNYLQDKTGTNKITQNGTYTPSTSGSIIGYSSVEVEVQTGTSLSGSWNNSRFTVTASPQGTTLQRDITHSAAYQDAQDSNKWKVEVYATVPGTGTPPTEEHFGHKINVMPVYNAGWNDAEAQFSLADITLQGTAYGSITPISGTYKFSYVTVYDAGTAVTYYKGNGSSVTGRGDSVSVTPISGTYKFSYATVYDAGTAVTYYQGNGGTKYARGDTVSAREVLNAGGTTYYTSSSTQVTAIGTKYWYKQHASTEKPTGTWYTEHTSDPGSGTRHIRYTAGTQYYIRGSTELHLASASTFYKGNGGSFVARGDTVTVTPIGTAHQYLKSDNSGSVVYYGAGSATTYYRGNGASVTGRGDSVSVTPIGTAHQYLKSDNSGSVVYYGAGTAVTNLRNPGTRYTDTYYTKS